MSLLTRCLAAAALFISPLAAVAEPELLPQPRLVESHVRLEMTKTGYNIILTRKAAEKLACALAAVGDGTPYTEVAKLTVRELNDPDAEKKVDLLAAIIKSQAPALTKSLKDKMGEGGAIIKVVGIENKIIPEPPPLAKAIGEAFLPEKLKEKMKNGIKVINTMPLYWTVEGRK
jgi:hypothetical protein